MHKELLSNKERQMIKMFLETGEKREGFRMLKMRIKRNYSCINEDFQLIEKVKEKL